MLMNIQTTSERADKKVWENNGLLEVTVFITNENSLDLAFIYPLKCLKKTKKNTRSRSYLPNTAHQKRALCKCCTCRTAQRRPVSNGSGAARQAVHFRGVLDHQN